MSQNTNQIGSTNQARGVSKKRNWRGIAFSSIVGGAIAVVVAPSITVTLVPYGIWRFFGGTISTGIIGSVVTKVAGNASNAGVVILTVYQYPTQQFYRRTLITYIGTVLETALHCLQTNNAFQYHNLVYFDIEDEFAFQDLDAKEKRRMFIDLTIRTIPRTGTQPSELNDGIAPPDLPNFDQNATRTVAIGDQEGVSDGVGWAILEGAAFGITDGGLAKAIPGGALAGTKIIETVKGKVGIIVGMSSATGVAGPVRNLTFPSEESSKAALFIEFATEVQHHINRLMQCAISNEVGLGINMSIGSATRQGASLAQPTGIAGTHSHIFLLEFRGKRLV